MINHIVKNKIRAAGLLAPHAAALLLAVILFQGCGGSMTGTISVQGNVPHTYTAITLDDGRTYKVTGKTEPALRRDHQGARVTIRGRLITEPDGTLPGVIEADSFSTLK
jgi:hypothetical protein